DGFGVFFYGGVEYLGNSPVVVGLVIIEGFAYDFAAQAAQRAEEVLGSRDSGERDNFQSGQVAQFQVAAIVGAAYADEAFGQKPCGELGHPRGNLADLRFVLVVEIILRGDGVGGGHFGVYHAGGAAQGTEGFAAGAEGQHPGFTQVDGGIHQHNVAVAVEAQVLETVIQYDGIA